MATAETLTQVQEKDSGNFFKAVTYNEPYWDDYLAARPKYSSEFYDRVIKYYKDHNGSRAPGIAHDVGTGPGQVAGELSKHFDQVIGSDANATHLTIASIRLEKAGLKKKLSWKDSGAEDLGSKFPAGSASMVTAAECLPLLDIPRAMASFSHLLRPDGTLAVWFYGRPHFTEPEFATECQPLINDILDSTFASTIQSGNQIANAAWKRATDTCESWLDDVVLPTDTWTDVQRVKWNPHLPMPVVGPNACDFPIEPSSNIQPSEKVIKIEDSKWWADLWDVREVRRFIECLIPSFEEKRARGEYQHVEPKYAKLEQAMGGPNAKRTFTWPVVLILATRK